MRWTPRERDHLLLIAETEGDRELENELIEAMQDRRVDGIILASMYTREVTVPGSLLEGHSVLLNAVPSAGSSVPCVLPDETEAGRSAARVLLEAGHTEGIYLVGADPKTNRVPRDSLAAADRLRGIKEMTAAAGVPLTGGVVRLHWQPSDGYEADAEAARAPPPSSRSHLLQRPPRSRRISSPSGGRHKGAGRNLHRLLRRRTGSVVA